VQGIAAIRTTAKDNKIFVHVFEWPSETLTIVGLKVKVASARLLASGLALKMGQTEDKLRIELPLQPPDPNVSTIALTTL
jgi:alpha-L-fucosidase